MSERNGIPLEEINMIGHHFTKEFHPPPSEEELGMQQQLAEQMKKQFEQNWGNQNQGFNGGQGNQGFNGGQGNQGFNGGQGGFNGGQGGFNGGQGGFNGGNGGFNGGFGGGGFNGGQGQGFNNQGQGQNPYALHNPNSNIYPSNNSPRNAKSNINVGPSFNIGDTVKRQ